LSSFLIEITPRSLMLSAPDYTSSGMAGVLDDAVQGRRSRRFLTNRHPIFNNLRGKFRFLFRARCYKRRERRASVAASLLLESEGWNPAGVQERMERYANNN